MVRDIAIQLVAGAYVLAICFKAIKQDRRIERPEARGDHRLEVAPLSCTWRGGQGRQRPLLHRAITNLRDQVYCCVTPKVTQL